MTWRFTADPCRRCLWAKGLRLCYNKRAQNPWTNKKFNLQSQKLEPQRWEGNVRLSCEGKSGYEELIIIYLETTEKKSQSINVLYHAAWARPSRYMGPFIRMCVSHEYFHTHIHTEEWWFFPNINNGESRGREGNGFPHCFLLCIITSNLNPQLLIQPPTDTHATYSHETHSSHLPSRLQQLSILKNLFHLLLNDMATKGEAAVH